ncbi:MAG: hypothetical protein RDV48_10120 [Candidatus Eremiobacteraeota bacterium]|nr:hypothetical protein [Candidatus Eremiobacteraeota bacterium]
MIKFRGTPKSSALLYWIENTSLQNKIHFASYLTISPVELQESDMLKADQLSFMYPIMVHEPIPVANIERVISEARERNATIVDCGRATAKSVRTRMRKALSEYLNAFISSYLEMEQKKKVFVTSGPSDLNLEHLKKKLRKTDSSKKVARITQLVGQLRLGLERDADLNNVYEIAGEIRKLRLESDPDFDRFLNIVVVPGAIADKISELYIKRFTNLVAENKYIVQECSEDIESFFTLKRLDELRDLTRKHIGEHRTEKALQTIEQIYKIKESQPPFCSGDDLDQFCRTLVEQGDQYDTLSKMYIEKYLLVIDKKFMEAGKIHRQIRHEEEKIRHEGRG